MTAMRAGPIELSGSGLSEAAAAASVAAGLAGLSGVSKVVANPLTERVVVLFDPAVIGVDGIVRALGAQGVDYDRARLVPGVRAAIVNGTAESLTVELILGRTDLGTVRATLLAQGFDPGPPPPASPTAEGSPDGKTSP